MKKFDYQKIFNNIYFRYALCGLSLLLLVLAKLLQKSSFHPTLFVWLDIISILLLVRKAKNKIDIVIAYFIYNIMNNIMYFGFYANVFVNIIVISLTTLLYFLPFLLDGFLTKKYSNSLIRTIIFPSALISVEMFLSVINISPAFLYTYELMNWPIIAQSVSIAGIYGLEFFILFTSNVIVNAMMFSFSNNNISIVIDFVLLICLCFYGFIRVNLVESEDKNIQVSYAIGPYSGIEKTGYTDFSYDEDIISFNKLCKEANDAGSEILVFSEESYEVSSAEYENFIENAKNKAKEYGMYIVLGVEIDSSEDDKGYNRAVLISKDGEILSIYNKHKLIPIIETSNFNVGKESLPCIKINVDGVDVNISIGICYDADFTTYCARLSDDVELLVILSWDWKEIAYQHTNITRVRSIENGVTIIKPTYDGYTPVFDKAGNIISITNTDETGFDVCKTVNIPIKTAHTVYETIDKIVYICPTLVVVGIVYIYFKDKKKKIF